MVIRENKILLGKRKSTLGTNKWAPPGGHLEFRESPKECAARELLEETALIALDIENGPWTNDIIDENKHYITIFMIIKKFEGSPVALEPDKCENWQWFSWNNLPQSLFAPFENLLKFTEFKI